MEPLTRSTPDRARRGSPVRGTDWTADVGALLGLLQSTDIAELEVESESFAFRVQRRPSGPVTPTASAPSHAPDTVTEPAVNSVTAPAVGIYRAPNGSQTEPLVRVGDSVPVGHFLGSVEAMGLATRVLSAAGGSIEHVGVADGQAVEYGQVLFSVRVG
jgi:biotin carboxyl carrier protein